MDEMTKENFTSINVIVDESGSMGGLVTDTVGGFNKFLADQKAVPGDAVLTLCTFNVDYRLVHNFQKIASVANLDHKTYCPGGGTALLDALGKTIDSVGDKLAAMPEDERPSKVIFLIITDGQENASRLFTKEAIRAKVTHQQDVYNWEFVFMGANMDAISEGHSLGIAAHNSMNYAASSSGTRSLYSAVSDSMTTYRGSGNARANFFDPNAQIIPLVTAPTNTISTASSKAKHAKKMSTKKSVKK